MQRTPDGGCSRHDTGCREEGDGRAIDGSRDEDKVQGRPSDTKVVVLNGTPAWNAHIVPFRSCCIRHGSSEYLCPEEQEHKTYGDSDDHRHEKKRQFLHRQYFLVVDALLFL